MECAYSRSEGDCAKINAFTVGQSAAQSVEKYREGRDGRFICGFCLQVHKC